ncbi:hypothetical protein [Burkholderia stabilis]|uniref:hypothetical protein n=1 Tax=Burkholderia stabilis TaxID=95485 RepID=UPI001F4B7580|nr:hypothetical protein [Burkholderia stabilis]
MSEGSQRLTISINDQCYWGACLSIAASSSIIDKSWVTLIWTIAIGVLLFLPALARRAWRREMRGAKVAAIALLAVFFTVIAMTGASIAERLTLINAETYPAWLANGHLALGSANTESPLFNDMTGRACRGRRGPRMILHKAGGEIVVRCDPFSYWPFTRTYVGYEK